LRERLKQDQWSHKLKQLRIQCFFSDQLTSRALTLGAIGRRQHFSNDPARLGQIRRIALLTTVVVVVVVVAASARRVLQHRGKARHAAFIPTATSTIARTARITDCAWFLPHRAKLCVPA
jgi:hypothetical protein